jgi:hypothetical protein
MPGCDVDRLLAFGILCVGPYWTLVYKRLMYCDCCVFLRSVGIVGATRTQEAVMSRATRCACLGR